MGLTTWENSPDWKILKSDVIIAKNYLNEQEIKNLNNLVNLFLDIAENNAERSITMYMEDWKNEVENALKVFHYEVLEGKGKISHKQAVEKAENEYEKYKVIQDKNYVSDFDRLLSETKQINCTLDKKAKINIIILDECYQKNNFNIINEYDGKDTLENNERIVVLINKR